MRGRVLGRCASFGCACLRCLLLGGSCEHFQVGWQQGMAVRTLERHQPNLPSHACACRKLSMALQWGRLCRRNGACKICADTSRDGKSGASARRRLPGSGGCRWRVQLQLLWCQDRSHARGILMCSRGVWRNPMRGKACDAASEPRRRWGELRSSGRCQGDWPFDPGC
mmetsp:Transcript_12104/g.37875  ORF Transcript_12104/g.37875 Transcript_12104/m.37875 type:complete len:168 (+) Transcript_12104:1250-1753(+)